MRPLRRKALPSSQAEPKISWRSRRLREAGVRPAHAAEDQRRLALLLGPAGPELSCAECFDELDRYVELRLAAPQEADHRIPGMRAHLDGCPACDDDHKSLLIFVAQQGIGRRLRALL